MEMSGWIRSLACLGLVAQVAFFMTGCARAHAKTAPQPPFLDVPPLPDREFTPAETEMPPPGELMEEPQRHAPPPLPPRKSAPPARTEPPKPEPSPPPEPTRPAEEPPKPLTLQLPSVGSDGQITQAVHEQLNRANNDLNRIDVRRLDPSAKAQYDTAKGIIRQANDALRAKNLVFAKSLADKAVGLAAQLAGR